MMTRTKILNYELNQPKIFSKRSRQLSAISIIILIFFLLFPSSNLLAKHMTKYDVQAMVEGWRSSESINEKKLGKKVKEVRGYGSENSRDLYYIVYLEPNGFVIVPADDLVEPIIGFVASGTYDPSPNNPLVALVNGDIQNRVRAARELDAKSGRTDLLPHKLRKANSKWNLFKAITIENNSIPDVKANDSANTVVSNIFDKRVEPLIEKKFGMSMKWSQGTVGGFLGIGAKACYNYYTPKYGYGNPNNYPCGCVATAMAQLMRFWQYPNFGVGTKNFPLFVDGEKQTNPEPLFGGNGVGGPYNWGNMPLQPNSNITDAQRQAIGALTHDAGVSVMLDYTTSGSGVINIGANRLRDTFGYSNAIGGWNNFHSLSSDIWKNMIKPNLDAGFPVLLAIFNSTSAHAIICDGYGFDTLSSNATEYYHINLGWSGTDDDVWYNLPTIDTPSANPDYNLIAICAYNIYPYGTGEIISGRVLDQNNNPIQGATVKATKDDGSTYYALSNNKGIYALKNLPSNSSYTISPYAYNNLAFNSQKVSTGQSIDNTTSVGNVWGVDFVPSYLIKTLNFLATRINNSGKIVGFQQDHESGVTNGILYDSKTDKSEILTCPGPPYYTHVTEFWGINNKDQIVGWYWPSDVYHTTSGFLYHRGFQPFKCPLGNHEEGHADDTHPAAINDMGQMVGEYIDASQISRAFLKNGQSWQNLGVGVYPRDINNKGQYLFKQIPAVYEIATGLPSFTLTIPGAVSIDPSGINNNGQIVGWYTDANNYGYAFLYADGKAITLGILVQPNGINDYGQIVGPGFLATPCSELPAAIKKADLVFATGGNTGWSSQANTFYCGTIAPQSGAIGDNQSSWMHTTINGPATVSFYWKVSSEQNHDFLQFYVDDTLKDSISGNVDWQQKTYSIPAGPHVIKWTYSKDVSGNAGSDCGWVDQLVYKPQKASISPILQLLINN
jgi:probable HAF family extracellular repeat protein